MEALEHFPFFLLSLSTFLHGFYQRWQKLALYIEEKVPRLVAFVSGYMTRKEKAK
jgi:hypothetical protein